jgi:hypothetical protein
MGNDTGDNLYLCTFQKVLTAQECIYASSLAEAEEVADTLLSSGEILFEEVSSVVYDVEKQGEHNLWAVLPVDLADEWEEWNER